MVILKGEFERKVMISIIKLGNRATIGQIISFIFMKTSLLVSFGSTYTTLTRLQGKGFVESGIGSPTKARGGKAKLYFSVTESGEFALMENEKLQEEFKLPVQGD